MLSFRQKLTLYYLLRAAIGVVFLTLFCVRRFVFAWLFYCATIPLERRLHPLPKAYRNVYRYRFVKGMFALFIAIVLAIAVADVVFFITGRPPEYFERFNAWGLAVVLAVLVPVSVFVIREEIKAARQADADAVAKSG
jgi:uncharacterized membrane protein YbhN (UPF0104 family)